MTDYASPSYSPPRQLYVKVRTDEVTGKEVFVPVEIYDKTDPLKPPEHLSLHWAIVSEAWVLAQFHSTQEAGNGSFWQAICNETVGVEIAAESFRYRFPFSCIEQVMTAGLDENTALAMAVISLAGQLQYHLLGPDSNPSLWRETVNAIDLATKRLAVFKQLAATLSSVKIPYLPEHLAQRFDL